MRKIRPTPRGDRVLAALAFTALMGLWALGSLVHIY